MPELEPMAGEDFAFEEDAHTYTTKTGVVRPSITQLMSSAGIYDFSRINPAVLENARRRGSNVHAWCAEWDISGWIDESWIAEDEMPYFQAWVRFRADTKVVIRKVEKPMLRAITGVLIGGTPDVEGFVGPTPFVIERKACASRHPGWGVQLAMQEMLITGKPRVGHLGRMAVQLKRDGTYKSFTYEEASDGDVALALVQKQGAEDAINNWMHNHGLKTAA